MAEQRKTNYAKKFPLETNITRTRDGMKNLNTFQTECDALNKACNKLVKVVRMGKVTSARNKILDELEFFAVQSLTTMQILRKELETYLTKLDVDDAEEEIKGTSDVPTSLHSEDGVLGLTGLNNTGNSCYMSSTIQCLNNTPSFVDYFKSNTYQPDRRNLHYQLVDTFADLIKDMWSGKPCINPLRFQREIGRYEPKFVDYTQQDAQEFLTFLMDKLHEGLTKIEGNDKPPDQTVVKNPRLDNTLHNKSIVEELFQFQIKKTFFCRTCKGKMENIQTFMCLFLPVTNPSYCTLDECLNEFFKNKSVLGKCMMPLPNCGDESDTLMQMEILELPKILIFALKRFVFVGEENRWKKNNAHVQFYPMRELDISRFAIGQPQKTYSLYAVSNHSGRLASGHYTACCRNPRNQKWYTFNDSNVNLASESKIETPDAYVLYYTSIPPVQEEKQRMSE